MSCRQRHARSRLALCALAPAAAAILAAAAGCGSLHRGLGLATAPQSAHQRVNPYAGNPAAVLAGRKLFLRHCAECHGEDAQGSRKVPSLASVMVRQAPPGDLFWFVTNGNLRAGMPAWSRLPAARRWQIVSFLTAQAAAGAAGR
jgi:mono/diheme cytochrome c family protein